MQYIVNPSMLNAKPQAPYKPLSDAEVRAIAAERAATTSMSRLSEPVENPGPGAAFIMGLGNDRATAATLPENLQGYFTGGNFTRNLAVPLAVGGGVAAMMGTAPVSVPLAMGTAALGMGISGGLEEALGQYSEGEFRPGALAGHTLLNAAAGAAGGGAGTYAFKALAGSAGRLGAESLSASLAKAFPGLSKGAVKALSYTPAGVADSLVGTMADAGVRYVAPGPQQGQFDPSSIPLGLLTYGGMTGLSHALSGLRPVSAAQAARDAYAGLKPEQRTALNLDFQSGNLYGKTQEQIAEAMRVNTEPGFSQEFPGLIAEAKSRPNFAGAPPELVPRMQTGNEYGLSPEMSRALSGIYGQEGYTTEFPGIANEARVRDLGYQSVFPIPPDIFTSGQTWRGPDGRFYVLPNEGQVAQAPFPLYQEPQPLQLTGPPGATQPPIDIPNGARTVYPEQDMALAAMAQDALNNVARDFTASNITEPWQGMMSRYAAGLDPANRQTDPGALLQALDGSPFPRATKHLPNSQDPAAPLPTPLPRRNNDGALRAGQKFTLTPDGRIVPIYTEAQTLPRPALPPGPEPIGVPGEMPYIDQAPRPAAPQRLDPNLRGPNEIDYGPATPQPVPARAPRASRRVDQTTHIRVNPPSPLVPMDPGAVKARSGVDSPKANVRATTRKIKNHDGDGYYKNWDNNKAPLYYRRTLKTGKRGKLEQVWYQVTDKGRLRKLDNRSKKSAFNLKSVEELYDAGILKPYSEADIGATVSGTDRQGGGTTIRTVRVGGKESFIETRTNWDSLGQTYHPVDADGNSLAGPKGFNSFEQAVAYLESANTGKPDVANARRLASEDILQRNADKLAPKQGRKNVDPSRAPLLDAEVEAYDAATNAQRPFRVEQLLERANQERFPDPQSKGHQDPVDIALEQGRISDLPGNEGLVQFNGRFLVDTDRLPAPSKRGDLVDEGLVQEYQDYIELHGTQHPDADITLEQTSNGLVLRNGAEAAEAARRANVNGFQPEVTIVARKDVLRAESRSPFQAEGNGGATGKVGDEAFALSGRANGLINSARRLSAELSDLERGASNAKPLLPDASASERQLARDAKGHTDSRIASARKGLESRINEIAGELAQRGVSNPIEVATRLTEDTYVPEGMMGPGSRAYEFDPETGTFYREPSIAESKLDSSGNQIDIVPRENVYPDPYSRATAPEPTEYSKVPEKWKMNGEQREKALKAVGNSDEQVTNRIDSVRQSAYEIQAIKDSIPGMDRKAVPLARKLIRDLTAIKGAKTRALIKEVKDAGGKTSVIKSLLRDDYSSLRNAPVGGVRKSNSGPGSSGLRSVLGEESVNKNTGELFEILDNIKSDLGELPGETLNRARERELDTRLTQRATKTINELNDMMLSQSTTDTTLSRGRVVSDQRMRDDASVSMGRDDNLLSSAPQRYDNASREVAQDTKPLTGQLKKKQTTLDALKTKLKDQRGAALNPASLPWKDFAKGWKEKASKWADSLYAGGAKRLENYNNRRTFHQLRVEIEDQVTRERSKPIAKQDPKKIQELYDTLDTHARQRFREEGWTDEEVQIEYDLKSKQRDMLSEAAVSANFEKYSKMTKPELAKLAREYKLPGRSKMNHEAMAKAVAINERYMELRDKGGKNLTERQRGLLISKAGMYGKTALEAANLHGSSFHTIEAIQRALIYSRASVKDRLEKLAPGKADSIIAQLENAVHIGAYERSRLTEAFDIMKGIRKHRGDIAVGWRDRFSATRKGRRRVTAGEMYDVQDIPGHALNKIPHLMAEDEWMNQLMHHMSMREVTRLYPHVENPQGMRFDDFNEYIKAVESTEIGREQIARAEEVFKLVDDETIGRLVDEKMMSEEDAAYLRRRKYYLPRLFLKDSKAEGLFSNIMEVREKDSSRITTGSRRVSYTDVPDILTDLFVGTGKYIQRNRANRELAAIITSDPQSAKKLGLSLHDKKPKTYERDDGIVFNFKDSEGKTKYILSTDKAFNEGWKLERTTHLLPNPGFWNFVSGTSALKVFTTGPLNPFFALRNTRDVGHLMLTTQDYNPFLPIGLSQFAIDMGQTVGDAFLSSSKGFFDITGAGDRPRGRRLAYAKQGGGAETLSADYTRGNENLTLFKRLSEDRTVAQDADGTGKLTNRKRDTLFWSKRALAAMESLNNSTETWIRLAHRERAIKNQLKGLTKEQYIAKNGELAYQDVEQKATWIARNRIDYSQGGWAGVEVGNIIAYLNPILQGVRTTGRALNENPVRFGLVGTQLAYLGYLQYKYWNGTEQNREDYERIHPAWRASNMAFNIPGLAHEDPETGRRIPFVVGLPKDDSIRTFMWIGEQFARKELGHELDTYGATDIALGFFGFEGSLNGPPTFQAITATFGDRGYDLFTHEEVWGGADVGEDGLFWKNNYRQYTDSTNRFYKKWGALTQSSPAQSQAFMGKLFNGASPVARGLGAISDYALSGMEDMTPEARAREKQKLQEALVRTFTGGLARYVPGDTMASDLSKLSGNLSAVKSFDRNTLKSEAITILADPGSTFQDIEDLKTAIRNNIPQKQAKRFMKDVNRALALRLQTNTHKRVYDKVWGNSDDVLRAVYAVDTMVNGTPEERTALQQLSRFMTTPGMKENYQLLLFDDKIGDLLGRWKAGEKITFNKQDAVRAIHSNK